MVVEQLGGQIDPVDACARFTDSPYCLLLQSAAQSEQVGRYSFLTADPFVVIRSTASVVQYIAAHDVRQAEGDCLDAIQAVLGEDAAERDPELPPFQGGVAGFLGYDLAHRLEGLPLVPADDAAVSDVCVGVYDWVLAWDHRRERSWLISTGRPAPSGERRRTRARARGGWVQDRLSRPARWAPPPMSLRGTAPPGRGQTFPVPSIPGAFSTFSPRGYCDAVNRVREYIRAGDVFQANISQRLEAGCVGHPFALYKALTRCNAAPFAAYFDVGDAALVSASPERFLRLQDGDVETRPIKGTARRGEAIQEDAALKNWLRDSEKDKAENVMIVDLLRNDLSKVCQDHSVQVPELCVLESYQTVHHLVSTVTGRLRTGLKAVDLLRAAFPGGSVTGAPKRRAMEIISELEPVRRGAYTGALGYIGFDGTMDMSVVIRTFTVKHERAFFHVGGGVLVDSDPQVEYLETLAKAKGLVAALGSLSGPAD